MNSIIMTASDVMKSKSAEHNRANIAIHLVMLIIFILLTVHGKRTFFPLVMGVFL